MFFNSVQGAGCVMMTKNSSHIFRYCLPFALSGNEIQYKDITDKPVEIDWQTGGDKLMESSEISEKRKCTLVQACCFQYCPTPSSLLIQLPQLQLLLPLLHYNRIFDKRAVTSTTLTTWFRQYDNTCRKMMIVWYPCFRLLWTMLKINKQS